MGFPSMTPVAASLAAVTLAAQMAVSRDQAAVIANRISMETTVTSVHLDTVLSQIAGLFQCFILLK